MKKIDLFERAIAEKADSLEAYGINSALCCAYRRSTEAGNELIDFDGAIWECEIEGIAKSLRENGIHEFTISSTYSSLIETLAAFEKQGFKMAGLTQVKEVYTDWQTGEHKLIPAIKMVG
ncbi:MAG: hypothetical protein LUI10_07405 [Lachnospiraceae bacterium]|nr:hypothetical protein [Lachnospiraceae bacterium]